MKSLRESLLCKNQFLTEECILHQKRFTQVMAIEGEKKKIMRIVHFYLNQDQYGFIKKSIRHQTNSGKIPNPDIFCERSSQCSSKVVKGKERLRKRHRLGESRGQMIDNHTQCESPDGRGREGVPRTQKSTSVNSGLQLISKLVSNVLFVLIFWFRPLYYS